MISVSRRGYNSMEPKAQHASCVRCLGTVQRPGAVFRLSATGQRLGAVSLPGQPCAMHAQVRVFRDQGGHLSESDLAAFEQRAVCCSVIDPAKDGQVVDVERHVRPALRQDNPIGRLRVDDGRQRIGTLADEMESPALAQVARVERSLVRMSATKVGDVKRIDVAAVVLRIDAGSGDQTRIEEILAVDALSGEKQDA